ncbi:MAG: hypothetical protein ACJAWX_003002, partial [Algoriphagus sp.]
FNFSQVIRKIRFPCFFNAIRKAFPLKKLEIHKKVFPG